MQSVKGSIAALLCAISSVQFGAALAKSLFPAVGAMGATLFRLSLATLLLCAIVRPWKEKLDPKARKPLLIYGASLGLMNMTFYLALERIPLGLGVALEFTGPLTLALATSRKRADFLWAALAIAGIGLILPSPQSVESIDPVGILFALLAGCFWVSYILSGQKLGTFLTAGRATSLGMLVGTLVAIPIYFLSPSTHFEAMLNPKILPLAFGVALFSSALPFSMEMIAMQGLPTRTFSILLSLEPAFAALSGFLLIHEHLSWTQGFAILCIMAASFGSAISAQEAVRTSKDLSPAETVL